MDGMPAMNTATSSSSQKDHPYNGLLQKMSTLESAAFQANYATRDVYKEEIADTTRPRWA